MTAMRRGAILLVLLVLTLPSLYSQPGQHYVPEILFANVEGEAVVFGGFIKSGRQSFPLLGFSSGATCKAYFLQIQGYLLNAAAHGDSFFFAGTAYLEGLPVILLVQLRNGEEPQATVIYSDAPLYGVDLLLINDTLYIAGYIYRYTPVVESDVIMIRYNYTSGEVKGSLVFGSAAFDDFPKRILSDGSNIVVVGDTYAYNVSQSDVLVARVKPDLTLVKGVAVGGAGRESAEDAVLMEDGSLLVVGSTIGGTGTPDAFVVRVSDIGGLTYLSAIIGYENEYAVSVFRSENSYIVVLYGEFEEDKKLALIVDYTSKDPWTMELRTVLAVNSSAGQVIPLRSRNTALAFKAGSYIAVLNLGGRAVCLEENCTLLTVNLLDFGEQAPNLFTGLYGWRPLWSVVDVREKPLLQASTLHLQVEEIPASNTGLLMGRQKYVKQVNILKEFVKFIERNMPLLLFTPMILAAVLIIIEMSKRGWS